MSRRLEVLVLCCYQVRLCRPTVGPARRRLSAFPLAPELLIFGIQEFDLKNHLYTFGDGIGLLLGTPPSPIRNPSAHNNQRDAGLVVRTTILFA